MEPAAPAVISFALLLIAQRKSAYVPRVGAKPTLSYWFYFRKVFEFSRRHDTGQSFGSLGSTGMFHEYLL